MSSLPSARRLFSPLINLSRQEHPIPTQPDTKMRSERRLTVLCVPAIRQPATKRDGRDLQTGAAEESVRHLGKVLGRRHCE